MASAAQHQQHRDRPVGLGDRPGLARGPDQTAEGDGETGRGDLARQVRTAHQVDAECRGDGQHNGGQHVVRQRSSDREEAGHGGDEARDRCAVIGQSLCGSEPDHRECEQDGDHSGEPDVVQGQGDDGPEDGGSTRGADPRRTPDGRPESDDGAARGGQDDEDRRCEPRRDPGRGRRDVDSDGLAEGGTHVVGGTHRRGGQLEEDRDGQHCRACERQAGGGTQPAGRGRGGDGPDEDAEQQAHGGGVRGVVERGSDHDERADDGSDRVARKGGDAAEADDGCSGSRYGHGRQERPDLAVAPEVGDGVVRDDLAEAGDQEIEPTEARGDERGDPQRRARDRDADPAEPQQREGGDEHGDRRDDRHLCADTGDQHGERRHERRHHERPGQRHQQHGQGHGGDHRTDGRHESGVADVSQPAGMASADDVERHESEPDRHESLTGHPQPAPGEEASASECGNGQDQQDDGAAADAEPGPRHGQERHRGDEEAESPEGEQDPGYRGPGQARLRAIGAPRRVGTASARSGVRRGVAQRRTGRRGHPHRGRRPHAGRHLQTQRGEELVGALHGREQLDRGGPGQGEVAVSALLRRLGKERVTVRAACRIGVRRHESEYLMT